MDRDADEAPTVPTPVASRRPPSVVDEADAVVVVGASAGGVETLKVLVRGFPNDLPAAVIVVLHLSATAESMLPQILARAGSLPVSSADDREPIESGHVYVAPRDCHVLVKPGFLRVVRTPKENLMRPAIDPLFRSAALSYGPRAIAIVLSGSRDDGAAGAREIANAGGQVIVQDPDEAAFPGMPMAAMAADHPYVANASDIAELVTAILGRPTG